MGASHSASSTHLLERADPVEVGLRLAAALRARWFGSSDEWAHPSSHLDSDEELLLLRERMLAITRAPLHEFLAAVPESPARRELTDAFWEFDGFRAYALAAVKADPSLGKLTYKAVPKHCTESEFWRLYFASVHAVFSDMPDEEPSPAKSRRTSRMTSPKRLPPLSLPRTKSNFLRQEPWARLGGELVWLLSPESPNLQQGKLHGGATVTAGPHDGVAGFSFESPSAVFELGERVPLDGEWTVACWFWADEATSMRKRCLVSAPDEEEHAVCSHGGELGVLLPEAGGGFHPCGFNLSVLGEEAKGWFHLAAVGGRAKTSFYLNGGCVGVSDAQAEHDLLYVGNTPPGAIGTLSQPWGVISDLRVFGRMLDEVELVTLARMVPEEDRPPMPSTEIIAQHARQREVIGAIHSLELAADMLASADVTLGSSIPRDKCDLKRMREDILDLSSRVKGDRNAQSQ